MTEPITFDPRVSDTLKWARESAGAELHLAPDLVQEVPRRLALLSVVVFVVYTVSEVRGLMTGGHGHPRLQYVVLAALYVVVLAVLSVSRRRTLSPRRFLDLAVLFEVVWVTAESVAAAEIPWTAPAGVALMWSPIAVIILIYPIIVPNTTVRTLVGSLAAATMEPLVLVVMWRFGVAELPTTLEVWMARLWPHVTAIAVAVVISRIMYRIGERLSEARRLGSYQLERLLGAGGMGQVWQASHRMLPRRAAVKLIQPERLDAGNREVAERALHRFDREAQATAMLRSPHTIELFDFGIAKDGTFYYVMELLEGVDLHLLVERDGMQPPARVVHILRQACHSLYEAHERGLLHRDIKPSNIVLCRYGMDLDFVKVLDFGLVKARSSAVASSRDAQLTAERRVIGTPAFMAPETVLGGEDADARSDLYALGCVGYWLLSGRLVFERGSPEAIMRAHLNEPPVPIAEILPDVPESLAGPIMACLAKDPAARPRTARHLDALLAAADLHEAWTTHRAEAWWEDWESGGGDRAPLR